MKRSSSQRLSGLEEFSSRGERAVQAQDCPCQPACLPYPVQVSGRALSACIKVFALLIGCKQAKSSLGEKKITKCCREGEALKSLLPFDNHSNKTSSGKSIPNKKFNKS